MINGFSRENVEAVLQKLEESGIVSAHMWDMFGIAITMKGSRYIFMTSHQSPIQAARAQEQLMSFMDKISVALPKEEKKVDDVPVDVPVDEEAVVPEEDENPKPKRGRKAKS